MLHQRVISKCYIKEFFCRKEFNMTKYKKAALAGFRRALPFSLYALAVIIMCLNVALIFDNVLWGDEAFSANMVRNDPYGMMQIIHFWDSHPPFYYFWLKLCSELLGHNSYIYHLASVIPYLGSALLAILCFPKRFGHIPTALFLIFTGLSSECLMYNVEIRMYSTATFFILCAFYAVYLILDENRKSAWWLLVICGLCASYSHLYCFMIAGLMVFFTGCAALLKHGKPALKPALFALFGFIIGYIPWLLEMFGRMAGMLGSWWMTAPATLKETVNMIFGGENTRKLLMPLLALMILMIGLIECRFVSRGEDRRLRLHIKCPNLKGFSTQMLFILVGCLTIACTFIVAYGFSYLIKPMLARRYVYPLTAVIALLLAVAVSYLLHYFKDHPAKVFFPEIPFIAKGLSLLLTTALLITGLQNYRIFYADCRYQENRTQEILSLIGDDPNYLVSNGVTHLSWTVFGYYYPETEGFDASHVAMTADDFWYFKATPMTEEEIASMTDRGYKYDEYKDMVFVKYHCALYHFYKES